jgi:hypothetical protein
MSATDGTQSARAASKARILAGSSMALLTAASIAYAIEDVELTVAAAQGPNWQAQGLVAEIDLSSNGLQGRIRIDTIRFAELPDPIRDIVIECPNLTMSQQAFA